MTSNEAAERLRQWLAVDGRYTDAHPMVDRLVDDALAAERSAGEREARRATVERIRERLNTDHGLSGSGVFAINEADLDAILDEEAAR